MKCNANLQSKSQTQYFNAMHILKVGYIPHQNMALYPTAIHLPFSEYLFYCTYPKIVYNNNREVMKYPVVKKQWCPFKTSGNFLVSHQIVLSLTNITKNQYLSSFIMSYYIVEKP